MTTFPLTGKFRTDLTDTLKLKIRFQIKKEPFDYYLLNDTILVINLKNACLIGYYGQETDTAPNFNNFIHCFDRSKKKNPLNFDEKSS
jgi:hypothetical protein